MSRGVSLEFENEAETERTRVDARSAADLPDAIDDGDGRRRALHPEHVTPEGGLTGCCVCGHPELFRQKDFPRGIGMAIVVGAAVLAPFTYYASLAVAAVLDLGLYLTWPEMVVCYVCHTRHRGFLPEPRHPRFDREIDERLRYGEKAVMGRPMRPGGTAGAPEPEH